VHVYLYALLFFQFPVYSSSTTQVACPVNGCVLHAKTSCESWIVVQSVHARAVYSSIAYSSLVGQVIVSHECALSANFASVTFPTFDTVNPREIPRVHVDVYTRGGVHNSGFSVALGRLSLRIVVPRVARDTAWPVVQRDLWTSIRGLCVTYLTDHNYILLLERSLRYGSSFLSSFLPSFLPSFHPSAHIARSFSLYLTSCWTFWFINSVEKWLNLSSPCWQSVVNLFEEIISFIQQFW